ncbi:MAG: hypothetical protein ABEI99_03840 [Halobaculum sp.]
MTTATDRVDDWFDRLRTTTHRRRVATVIAVVVGGGAAAVSWLGLFLLGALVGLTRQTLPRAVGAGVVIGVGAVGVTAAFTPASAVVVFTTFTPISYLPLVFGLAPAVGALVRGVV